MATIRGIKKRVKSVKNISQITNAMQMVAASKMKRAQDKTQQFQPYAEKIVEAVKELSSGVDHEQHALLAEGNPEGQHLIVVIATDKGLCGSLNSNLFRQINKWYQSEEKVVYITIGRKGRNFISHSKGELLADFSGEEPTKIMSAVNSLIIMGFLERKYSRVELVFNRFVNSFQQRPTRIKILPITSQKIDETLSEEKENDHLRDFLIEPSLRSVLDALLPAFVENQIRDASYSAEASEHSARMIAMKNATDNAKGLVKDLTLEYNKLRQQEITLAIQDMVTARLSVK